MAVSQSAGGMKNALSLLSLFLLLLEMNGSWCAVLKFMCPLSILIVLSIFMVTVAMVLCALYIAQQRFQMSDRTAQSSAAASRETVFE